MNIVMLGHSKAGKTTYVSLMYEQMHDGISGFSIGAADPDQHHSLLDTAREVHRGRYPDPTAQRTMYELVLQHNGVDVFPFTWRDYRGGALSGRSTTSDVGELHTDLTLADGIVLFCDAQDLVTNRRARRDVRTITTHVQRALDAREHSVVPLVITLTKADLVDIDNERIQERLVEPFAALIEAISATTHVMGTVIPVACGRETFNVPVPVLWSLRYGIIGRALRLQASIEAAESAAEYAAARDTLWDRVSSWWNDEPTWASIRDRHRREALAEATILQPLISPAEQLGELLDETSEF